MSRPVRAGIGYGATNPGPREVRVGWLPTPDGSVLAVRRVGAPVRQRLTFSGCWAVIDAAGQRLATALMPLTSDEMSIEVGSRSLTLRMPGRRRLRSPADFAVVDDANGGQVVAGARLSGGRERNCVCERWQVALPGDRRVELVYRVAEPRTLGFYDHSGAPLMTLGHDPSFTARAGDGWVRVLLRLWGAALASGDRYLVQVHDRSIDVALLALIAVWMERTADGRYPTSTGA